MSGKGANKQSRTSTPIIVAALASCAFLALVALAEAFGGSVGAAGNAQAASDQSLAYLTTGFAVAGIPAIAAWGISVSHRCINVTIRRILMGVVVAMGIWLCVACVAAALFNLVEPSIIAIAVVSDLLIALLVELYIDARIFPSIHRYRMLFRRLPFDLKIMNDGGRVIYKTDIARPLDNTTLWRLAENAPRRTAEATALYSESLPDSVFKVYRLNAGTALLTESITESNRLQQRLEERQDQLTQQNEILLRNHAMQSLLYRQRRERELGERVEHDLASTAAQIRNILDHRIVGSGAYIRDERLQQLNLVKVLVAYSKRKGMLALAAAESETFTSEQISLIAREAMADLHSIGIECAILVESPAPIAISAFNTIYDCFYDCILSVLPRTNPVIMTYITTHGEDTLEMRAVIECAIGLSEDDEAPAIPEIATSTDSWTAVQMGIAHDLDGRLATRGGDYAVALDEGLVNVTVRAVAPAEPTGPAAPAAPQDAAPIAPIEPVQPENGEGGER